MEGSVKERLTGALILIAVLVIVVPEMLSGPDGSHDGGAPNAPEAGPPMRSYKLQLDTPAAQQAPDQSTLTPQAQTAVPAAATAVAPAPKPAPAETAPATPAAAVPPKPEEPASTQPTPAPPKPATASTAKSTPQPAAAAGHWWAQLGSFSARDNADRLARQLRDAGYQMEVSRIRVAGKDLYRVRAGPVASREAAVSLQTRLAAAGHKSSLVAP